ncbi:IS5 family transposase [Candidatus Poriferisodalis sp.]|uniref:IS5 family transposase n=1 Tax=Candidatus Poriferisodalis sp. TaxID=3101277 RepID=UPI003D0BCD46
MEAGFIMRALEPEVVDVIWAAVEPMLPVRPVGGPGRGHRPRIPDRLCFWGILVRLATGCSWQCAEALLGWQVSDTTLRSRRDEWVAAGVFERIAAEAIAAYDRIVGLDLDDVCIDGSTHKAPCGGEGTGKSPVDRRKSGWKWSIAIDGAGIAVGWAAAGANRNDIMLFDPTVAEIERRGLHHDTETLHLDRGYWGARVDRSAAAAGICDLVRPPKRRPGHDGPAEPVTAPLGLRWRVERTNSWLSNYGQLRRNTDRKPEHRLAQLALAVALIITIKLIDHRNRWQPHNRPTR